MGGSITYLTLEDLTLSLGSGGNTFTVQSTHSGTPRKTTSLQRQHWRSGHHR
ncbi:hypothetical protein [Cyanobium sp. ATX-6F1]|uniref:hypothetical protein n=1 Tax=Cyanobium sp. ATX-6F1 TaxID=3137388 RepID=UPI0039BE0C0A